MEQLFLVTLAGLAASFVDGALGMGFGPTSSTILLAAGLAPAAAALSVNIAKLASGAAGGFAHWKAGNVDRRLAAQLAGPGVIGAAIGGFALGSIDKDAVRPILAFVLVGAAVRILAKFSRATQTTGQPATDGDAVSTVPRRDPRLMLLALVGGLTNGIAGVWGPVVTPMLMTRSDIEPRVAVGSTNFAEVAVASSAVAALLGGAGAGQLDMSILAALLVGGVLAAPLAAIAVKAVQPRVLGIGVGLLLFGLNIGTMGAAIGGTAGRIVVAGVTLCTLGLVARNIAGSRSAHNAGPATAEPELASHGL